MGMGVMLALGLLCIKPAGAQTTVGTILGTITDSSGAVVPSTTVTVTSTDTGISRRVETDTAGNYQVPNLLPGNYTITAEQKGFQRAVVNGIVLRVNQAARYDLRLEVGRVAQQVVVSAQGLAQLQTDDAALGQVVAQRQVEDLPLNGRNFMQLVTLGAGAAPVVNQDRGSAVEGDTGRTGLSYTISGESTTSMSYLVDGVEDRFNFDMVAAWLPSLDSIQEFKLQRNAFSAEFGGAPAIVNVATKSGTNRLHGSLFEYVRNNIFDASQIQDPIVNGKRQISPYRQNQFGVSLGGPLVLPKIYNGKNRTFWFFDYESFRSRRFAEFIGTTISTPERTGDFSNLRDANGNVIPIYDPATYDPTTGLRQQFPGNVIPTSRMSPMGLKLLAFAPLPTVAGTNVTQANSFAGFDTIKNDNQYSGRIDHAISDKTTIFGRFSWYNSPFIFPGGTAAIDATNRPLDDRNAAFAVTYTVSPTTINELHLGWNKESFDVIPYNPSGQNITAALGIMNLSPLPQQYGAPAVFGNDIGFGPPNWDIVSGGNLFQYSDHLVMIRGKHTIKVGGDILDERPWSLLEDTSKRGTYTFYGDYTSQLQSGVDVPDTGSDAADMLLGLPRESQGSIGSTHTKFTWQNYHVFVQDDIKVRPTLTLSLGYRYEYNMHFKPEDNDIEGFCVGCYQNGEPGMLVSTKLHQVRSQVVDPDWHQHGPRVGFAWTPFGMKNTVVRAGAGIFYENTKGDETNMEEYAPDKVNMVTLLNSNPTPMLTLDQTFPASSPGFNSAPFVTNPQDKWPQVNQWNLNVQHKFGANWMVEVGYVGSHGDHLQTRFQQNQAYPDKDPLNPTPIQSRVPYPLYSSSLLASDKFGIANYNGLQMRAEKTFSHGFTLLIGYTFSRCQNMANADNSGTNNQNAHDLRADYGLCGFQIRNRFSASGIWDIPSGLHGFMGGVTKGWELNSILQMQSGQPFMPGIPGDWANVGNVFGWEELNRVCDGNLPASRRSVSEWFDTSCFVPPERGTFGNSGRDILIGPPYHTLDVSLFRNFRVGENAKFQFRVEAFNSLNNGNYNQPGEAYGQFGYGQIISENDKREIQFALRLEF
jgi:hypothetical protein